MAVYTYTAKRLEKRSEPIGGTITADSPRQARDNLRVQGLSIQNIVEQTPDRAKGVISHYLNGRQTGKVTGFLQELATLLSAGIQLLEALGTISRQHTGRFHQSLLLLRDHVGAGGSLAEAMRLQPGLFDGICISIVEVGESSGKLDLALSRLIEFRRRSAGIKNRVASALIYPCIVMFVGLAISIFLMTYVVPNLLGVLIDSGKDLPMATVIIKGVSDFIIGWWWAILLAAIGLTVGITAILRTDKGSMIWHKMQLKIPLVGELIRKQAIARMSMVISTLLKSDLVFIRAIQIAQRTMHNKVLREALVTCERAVHAGQDISTALENTNAFPPLVIQIFASGQASGRLEEMLENLAADYDTQVDITSSRLVTLLEPVMMICLAIVVGFIAFATILPILEAGDVL